MSDERLRSTYDRMLMFRAETTTDRSHCPAVERLGALVRREEDEESRLALLDHVMSCPFCQAEFELLRIAARASGAEAVPPVSD
jgi:hypothetical protein